MSLIPTDPLQLSLLARGAIRLDGGIVRAAADDAVSRQALDDTAGALVRKKLAGWMTIVDRKLAWRHQGGKPIGLIITDLGRGIIDAIEAEVADAGPAQRKIGQVITMLNAPAGVSLMEITTTTGWQPHSARAALSTLRKRGFKITKAPERDGHSTRYRIGEEVVQ